MRFFVDRCQNNVYGSRIWISSDSSPALIKTLGKMSFWGAFDKRIYNEPRENRINFDCYYSFEMDDDTLNNAILLCQENRMTRFEPDQAFHKEYCHYA